jgi:hypothetical protein
MQTIPYTSLTSSISGANSSNFGYSIWFYVDDWNYNYGTQKVLFGRMNSTQSVSGSSAGSLDLSTLGPCPLVTLGATENDLSISLAVFPNSSTSYQTYAFTDYRIQGDLGPKLGTVTQCEKFCDDNSKCNGFAYNGKQCYLKELTGNSKPSYNPNITYYYKGAGPPGPATIPSGTTPPSISNYIVNTTTVQNIPIQKWVNLIISVYGRTLDVYLDGKLVKTSVLPGTANIAQSANAYITPMGGFSGYTSRFQYYPNAIDPQTAWNIYTKGYTNLSLMGNYQLNISITNNGQTTGSLTI